MLLRGMREFGARGLWEVFSPAYLGFILVFGMFTRLGKGVASKSFNTRASALAHDGALHDM